MTLSSSIRQALPEIRNALSQQIRIITSLIAQSLDILSEHGTIIASTNAANMTVQQFKKQLRKGLGDVTADFVNLQQLPADFTVNPNDPTSNYLKVYTIG